MHKISIKPHPNNNLSQLLLLDGKRVEGIQSATLMFSATEIPEIDIELAAIDIDIDALAKTHMMVDIGSVEDAIRCITLTMRLDAEFRQAVIASARSAIDRSLSDEELAEAIVERIFIGER